MRNDLEWGVSAMVIRGVGLSVGRKYNLTTDVRRYGASSHGMVPLRGPAL